MAAPGEPGQVAVYSVQYSAVQCCVQYTPGHQSASELSPSGTESPHPVTAVSTRTSAAADVSYVISCARGLVTAARVSHLAPCHVSRVHGYDGVWAGSRVQGHLQGGVQLDVPARVVVGGETGE